MALYVRELTSKEQKRIDTLICDPETDLPPNRLMIIKLSAKGQRVPQISNAVRLHPINVRKWIHRFNKQGIDGLRTGKSTGRPPIFDEEQRRQIAEIAGASPQKLGLPFNRWSLQRLRRYLIKQGIVEHISIETIRQIIRSEDETRHSSTNGS